MPSIFKHGVTFRINNAKTYDPDYKESAHVVRVPPSPPMPDQCENELESRLMHARLIRDSHRRTEDPISAFRDIYFGGYGSIEDKFVSDLSVRDRKGLVGEILTEMMVDQCYDSFEIILRNWRRTGHANQGGMDLVGVWSRGNTRILTLIDSKLCGPGAHNPEEYVRGRIEEAVGGLEEYQENEVKLGRVFKWIAEQTLRSQTSDQGLRELVGFLEGAPRMNSPSMIITTSIDFASLLQNPPSVITSTRSRTALACVDFTDCTFVVRLVS